MTPTLVESPADAAADAAPVRLTSVTDPLGISRDVRRELIEQRLITPVKPVTRGRPTCVCAQEAERIRTAYKIGMAIGVSIVIVLKVIKAL